MHQYLSKKYSFTIVELLIVVTLTGIIAAFAIPNYNKAIQRSYQRRMIAEMYTMNAAMLVYKAKTGGYPEFDVSETSAVAPFDHANFNTIFGSNMPPSEFEYEYRRLSGADRHKFAIWAPLGWGMHFHEDNLSCPLNAMHCTALCRNGGIAGTDCPSCPDCNGAGACGCGAITW